MILFLEQFITGSLCLFLALSGLLSGSLSLAHSGSLWLTLAHSGSLWLAARLSQALSGSLLLSKFAYQALAQLGTPFLRSLTLISPEV